MPRFFKVYGTVDPAMEALREADQFARDTQEMVEMARKAEEINRRFINYVTLPWEEAMAAMQIPATDSPRGLAAFFTYDSRSWRSYWPKDIPVVAAVDWSPPPIKKGCRFRMNNRRTSSIDRPLIEFV